MICDYDRRLVVQHFLRRPVVLRRGYDLRRIDLDCAQREVIVYYVVPAGFFVTICEINIATKVQ